MRAAASARSPASRSASRATCSGAASGSVTAAVAASAVARRGRARGTPSAPRRGRRGGRPRRASPRRARRAPRTAPAGPTGPCASATGRASSGAAGQLPATTSRSFARVMPTYSVRTSSAPSTRRRRASTACQPGVGAPSRAYSKRPPNSSASVPGPRSPRRLAIGLEQVDVGEVQPLGLVDRHHPHGVLGRRERPPLLGLACLGDARPQPAHDRLAARRPASIASSSVRKKRSRFAVRYAPMVRAASLASNSVAVRRRSTNTAGGLARERAAQLGQPFQERRQVALPPLHARQARDPLGERAGRFRHQRREPIEFGRVRRRELGDAVGERTRPQRDERGVGHADEARAQRRDQRQVVAGVEDRADERRRLDDLAAAVVGAVALDDVGNAGVAQRLDDDVERAGGAQQHAELPPQGRPRRAPRGCRPRARAPRSPPASRAVVAANPSAPSSGRVHDTQCSTGARRPSRTGGAAARSALGSSGWNAG